MRPKAGRKREKKGRKVSESLKKQNLTAIVTAKEKKGSKKVPTAQWQESVCPFCLFRVARAAGEKAPSVAINA